jgi:hypothetical protein
MRTLAPPAELEEINRLLNTWLQGPADDQRWEPPPAHMALRDEGTALLLTLGQTGRGASARQILERRGHNPGLYAQWLPALMPDGALVVVRRFERGERCAGPLLSADELQAVRRLLG